MRSEELDRAVPETVFEKRAKNLKRAKAPLKLQNVLKKPKDSSYLQVGDLICLTSKEKVSGHSEVITGDGVADSDLQCVPQNKLKELKGIQFRQALFRIEPKRQCGLQNLYSHYKKSRQPDKQLLKKLKAAVQKEKASNDSDLEASRGNILCYGERIQLRHLHSNCFVTISDEIGKQSGNSKMKLDFKGNENSWVEVQSSNNLRLEGEPCRYSDTFVLACKQHFIHMGSVQEGLCEVNASKDKSFWKAHKYLSVVEAPEKVSVGDSFRLFHKHLEGYLSIKSGESEEVVVNKKKSCKDLWEFQKPDLFSGGPILLGENIALRHIGTGMYLCVENQEVKLSNEPFERFKAVTDSELKFNSYIQLQFGSEFVFCEENSLGLSRKDTSKTTFLIELEPNSAHVHQISRVVTKFVEFYEFLKDWGDSYTAALTTETQLQENTLELLDILKNFTKRILKKANLEQLKPRQDVVRELGLLDLFLELNQLIDAKLCVESKPTTLPSITFIKQLMKSQLLECPQALAQKHLEKLSRKIYSTMFYCLKNNLDSCQVFYKYDEFLAKQLTFYSSEIGALIKEVFRHSANNLNSNTFNKFLSWARQLEPIDESNLKEQKLVFKILGTLCIYQNKGIHKYQYLINKALFEKQLSLVEFQTVKKHQCIHFKNKGNNPTLEKLYQTGVTYIPLSEVSLHKNLVDYLSSLLWLLRNLCLSGFKLGIKNVKRLNLDFEFLFWSLQDPNIHIKLRKLFLSLIRVMYLELNKPNKCYFWDTQNRVLVETQLKDSFLSSFVNWVEACWTQHSLFSPSDSSVHKSDFAAELITTTKALLKSNVEYEFFVSVFPSILELINPLNTEHWCSHLMKETKKLSFESFRKLLDGALGLLETGGLARTNKQVKTILNNLETSSELFIDELIEDSYLEESSQHLEVLLINLLSHIKNKKTEKKCLRVIMNNSSQKQAIKTQLSEVYLVCQPLEYQVWKVLSCNIEVLEELLQKLCLKGHLGEFLESQRTTKTQNLVLTTVRCLKKVKKLLSCNTKVLKCSQKIAKSLNLHRTLMDFLEAKFPWTEYCGSGIRILPEFYKVYLEIFHTLNAFTFRNNTNQELLSPYVELIVSYFRNNLGTTKLLSQVFSSQKSKDSATSLVDYIFCLIKTPKDYKELKMIRTLIIDEEYCINSVCQSNVLKKAQFFFTENFLGSQKFQANLLLLLATCAVNNEFATLQCRKLVPYESLLETLESPETTYEVKKACLHFVCFVYFVDVSKDCLRGQELKHLVEILQKVVLPELKLFLSHFESFAEFCSLDLIGSVSVFKEMPQNEQLSLDESASLEIQEQTSEEAKKDFIAENKELSQLFSYILEAKPWKLELASGVLVFLRDVFIELKYTESSLSWLESTAEELQFVLEEIYNRVNKLQTENPLLQPEVLQNTLGLVLSGLQVQSNQTYQKKLLKSICNYIQNSKTTVEDFLKVHLKVTSDFISNKDLSFKIKDLLGSNIDVFTIHQALTNINQTYRGVVVEISSFKTYIKSNLTQDLLSTQSSEMEIWSFEPNKKLKTLLSSSQSTQFKRLSEKIKLNFTDEKSLYEFCVNLKAAFSKNEYQVQLMELFKCMLEGTKSLQKQLTSIGLGELALSTIRTTSSFDLVQKSVSVLNALLKSNNNEFKGRLFAYLTQTQSWFFVFVKFFLRETKDRVSKIALESNLYTQRFGSSRLQNTPDSGKNQLCCEILLLLQLFCDNCYLPFQNYLREQKVTQSVDLVDEVCGLLLVLKPCESFELDRLILQCLKTLTDFCQGPCSENQKKLGKNLLIYNFFQQVFDFQQNFEEGLYFDILSETLNFLHSLLEEDTNRNISKIMVKRLDLGTLLRISTQIYLKFIKSKEQVVNQEGKGQHIPWLKFLELSEYYLDTREQLIIETGFKISTMFLTLEDRVPQKLAIKLQVLNSELNQDIKSKNFFGALVAIEEHENLRELLSHQLKSFWERFRFCCHKNQVAPEQEEVRNAHRYYSSNITSVEIQHKNKLAKLFFRIPSMCNYLTKHTRKNIIFKNLKNSHQEKIDEFFSNSKLYQLEMEYQQKLSRYPFLSKACGMWKVYASASFYLVVAINLVLLFSATRETQDNWEFSSKGLGSVVRFIGVFQVFFAVLVLVCYLTEYYPVIIKNNELAVDQETHRLYNKEAYSRVQGSVLMKALVKNKKHFQRTKLGDFLLVLQDLQVSYSLLYLLVSLLALIHFMLYGVLLLDLVKRNENLLNVLRSVSLNSKQLLLTSVFGVIVLYLFSTIGLVYFSEYYLAETDDAEMNTYCGNLLECFVSTSAVGLRAGGGLGDWIGQATQEDSKYWARMAFDLSFFIVVTVVLLNIIFGIIIDTFGELRDERKAKLQEMAENCFICGLNKFQFEMKRLSWNKHTQIDHSLFSYLSFLVHINCKPLEDCNGAEKYVKEQMQENNLAFFPQNSQLLEECQSNQNELIVESLKNIQQEIFNIADS